MAAITKRLLHLRPTFHSYVRPYPYPHRHFSSSDDRDDDPQSEQSQTYSSIFSSLSDVSASLQNRPPPPPRIRRKPPRSSFSSPSGSPFQNPPPPRAGSTDEIGLRLAEFCARAAPPPPSGDKYVSLHEIYEKNLKSKGESSDAPDGIGAGVGKHSFDSIRESLSKLESTGVANSGRKPGDSWSLSHFTENLKMKADPNGKLAAGSGGLISLFSQKEAKGKGDGGVGLRMEFGKMHDRSELGKEAAGDEAREAEGEVIFVAGNKRQPR